MERGITSASAGVLSLCLGTVALAQGTTTASPGQLEEVVVSGYRESLEVALDAKRDSVNFTDSITAEDVGKLPDNNLAEALQRVPGVQISRTNGEGQQISIRGMGPSFVRVLLDGMPVSAASEGSVDQQARNREFDFDLLPSEIFSMLQVSKHPGPASSKAACRARWICARPAPSITTISRPAISCKARINPLPKKSIHAAASWSARTGTASSARCSACPCLSEHFRTDGWTSQGWTSGRIPGNPPAARAIQAVSIGISPSVNTHAGESARPTIVNESGLTNNAAGQRAGAAPRTARNATRRSRSRRRHAGVAVGADRQPVVQPRCDLRQAGREFRSLHQQPAGEKHHAANRGRRPASAISRRAISRSTATTR